LIPVAVNVKLFGTSGVATTTDGVKVKPFPSVFSATTPATSAPLVSLMFVFPVTELASSVPEVVTSTFENDVTVAPFAGDTVTLTAAQFTLVVCVVPSGHVIEVVGVDGVDVPLLPPPPPPQLAMKMVVSNNRVLHRILRVFVNRDMRPPYRV
jgi:hypothetical protein